MSRSSSGGGGGKSGGGKSGGGKSGAVQVHSRVEKERAMTLLCDLKEERDEAVHASRSVLNKASVGSGRQHKSTHIE
jgi:hypothetical protein